MFLRKLYLSSFRNFKEQEFIFDNPLIVISAANGKGKSNLLEAIQVLSYGLSPRSHKNEELMSWEKEQSNSGITHIWGKIDYPDKIAVDIKFTLEKNSNQSVNKLLKADDKNIKGSTFAKYLKTISFSPLSIEIITGGPAERRKFFEHLLCLLNPSLNKTYQKYDKILRQRNRLLYSLKKMDKKESPQIQHWNELLIKEGTPIIKEHFSATPLINKFVQNLAPQIFHKKEPVEMKYLPSFSPIDISKTLFIAKKFRETLELKKNKELVYGYTLFGPHRDDWDLMLNNHSLRVYGSRGEQRLGSLLLITAAMFLIHKNLPQPPLLLLDDVLSELDPLHHKLVLKQLEKRPGQTIMTTTTLDYLPQKFLEKAQIILL